MKIIKKKAYAKVNLALDVIRKREDGYHDVKMIMQNLNIFDELEFFLDEESGTRSIIIETNREDIPTDKRNLIYKAIDIMFDEYDINADIRVKLTKNIPVEAGMAGGSTDCAAAIRAVNELFNLNLDEEEMMKIGVKLGADVPYCIMARTALSEGIGEILTPVNPLPDCYVVVAKPPVNVSTKMVYEGLNIKDMKSHPRVDDMVLALSERNLYKTAECMENVLETVTVKLYPEIEKIKDIMKEKGALNAIMSGSGPTVFGIYDDITSAQGAAEYLEKNAYSKEVFVTKPV